MAQNQSNVIDLFGIMEEQEPDLCIICQENLNDNDLNQQVYQIPDCKCKYHTNCIVTWFRCGSNKCPLCGDPGGMCVKYGLNEDCQHRQIVAREAEVDRLWQIVMEAVATWQSAPSEKQSCRDDMNRDIKDSNKEQNDGD